MAAPIQRQYRRDQQAGWPGALARPYEPNAYDTGQLYVPPGGTAPEPGMAVVYDATRNRFALPTTAAQVKDIVGLVSYDSGTVQGSLASPPGNANSDAMVQYADGDVVKIGVLGTFYVLAQSALEYGDRVRWRTADGQWEAAATASTFGSAVDRAAHTFANAHVTDDLDPPGTLANPDHDLAANDGSDSSRDYWNAAFAAVIDSLNAVRTTLDGWRGLPAVCVSPTPVAAGGLAEVRFGHGRQF